MQPQAKKVSQAYQHRPENKSSFNSGYDTDKHEAEKTSDPFFTAHPQNPFFTKSSQPVATPIIQTKPNNVNRKPSLEENEEGKEDDVDIEESAGQSEIKEKPVQKKSTGESVVNTAFGKFVTTQFSEYIYSGVEEFDSIGVNITLWFHPDKTKVDAEKIALSQSLKSTSGGIPYSNDPTSGKRMVKSSKSTDGYKLDRVSDKNNPIYGSENQTPDSDLKDTPLNNNPDPTVNVGSDKTYQLGQCYKVNPKDMEKTVIPAGLCDKPSGGIGDSKIFETTALAIAGADKGNYYGSVKWGYEIKGTLKAPIVEEKKITIASNGTPTANFMEPAKLWNTSKARGTIKVTADPEAKVWNDATRKYEKVYKNTNLKVLTTIGLDGIPSVQAEVLKTDGKGSGRIVIIKVSDIMDMGDGEETIDLPIVNVKITKTQITEVTNLLTATPPGKSTPNVSKKPRVIPANTRVEIISDGLSHLHGDKPPQIKVLQGPLIGLIITISRKDIAKLENEGL